MNERHFLVNLSPTAVRLTDDCNRTERWPLSNESSTWAVKGKTERRLAPEERAFRWLMYIVAAYALGAFFLWLLVLLGGAE